MKFYAVANKPNVSKLILNDDIDDLVIYTIVGKLKHCNEYVNKFIKMKNYSHFLNWCDAHSINPEDRYAWGKYCSVVVKNQFRGFYVSPLKLNKYSLAAVLRFSNSCVPVGCSYESPSEIRTFITVHCKDENSKELVEKLKEIEDCLHSI